MSSRDSKRPKYTNEIIEISDTEDEYEEDKDGKQEVLQILETDVEDSERTETEPEYDIDPEPVNTKLNSENNEVPNDFLGFVFKPQWKDVVKHPDKKNDLSQTARNYSDLDAYLQSQQPGFLKDYTVNETAPSHYTTFENYQGPLYCSNDSKSKTPFYDQKSKSCVDLAYVLRHWTPDEQFTLLYTVAYFLLPPYHKDAKVLEQKQQELVEFWRKKPEVLQHLFDKDPILFFKAAFSSLNSRPKSPWEWVKFSKAFNSIQDMAVNASIHRPDIKLRGTAPAIRDDPLYGIYNLPFMHLLYQKALREIWNGNFDIHDEETFSDTKLYKLLHLVDKEVFNMSLPFYALYTLDPFKQIDPNLTRLVLTWDKLIEMPRAYGYQTEYLCTLPDETIQPICIILVGRYAIEELFRHQENKINLGLDQVIITLIHELMHALDKFYFTGDGGHHVPWHFIFEQYVGVRNMDLVKVDCPFFVLNLHAAIPNLSDVFRELARDFQTKYDNYLFRLTESDTRNSPDLLTYKSWLEGNARRLAIKYRKHVSEELKRVYTFAPLNSLQQSRHALHAFRINIHTYIAGIHRQAEIFAAAFVVDLLQERRQSYR